MFSYRSFLPLITSKSCSRSCPSRFLSSSVISRVVMVFSNSSVWSALSFFFVLHYLVMVPLSLVLSFPIGEQERPKSYLHIHFLFLVRTTNFTTRMPVFKLKSNFISIQNFKAGNVKPPGMHWSKDF